MSEETTQDIAEKALSGKVYELGYHLVPSLDDAGALQEAGNIKKEIEAMGGVFIAEELPKPMELAYQIEKPIANKKQKFMTAYFGWIKFELDGDKAEKMNKELIRDDRMVRHLLIKTVRENTLISKRMNTRTEGTRKKLVLKREAEEPAVEINKEEVDKKLDELLALE